MEVPERGSPDTTTTVWALPGLLDDEREPNTFFSMFHHGCRLPRQGVDAILFGDIVPATQEAGMTAYVIFDIDVQDATTYKEYAALAPATVAMYGGKYLARAGRTEKLEGDWVPKRLVILQFETLERAREWLD